VLQSRRNKFFLPKGKGKVFQNGGMLQVLAAFLSLQKNKDIFNLEVSFEHPSLVALLS
jgi:hypothetical protein